MSQTTAAYATAHDAPLVVHAPRAAFALLPPHLEPPPMAESHRVQVSTAARAVTALLELVLFVATGGIGWAAWATRTLPAGRTPAMALWGQQALDVQGDEPATSLVAVWSPRGRTQVVYTRVA